MKVIFTDNVAGVAHKGDVKNVKNGFFRNFLQPYKKAAAATDALLRDWEEKKKRLMIEREQLRSKLEEVQRRVSGARLLIEKKVTKKGTLYGGVKPSDIVAAAKAQYSIDLPEETVKIANAIKQVGAYEVTLNLGEGVAAILPVEIIEKT